MRIKRVLAVASGGGHWVQMMRLRKAFEGYEVAYLTVQSDYHRQVTGSRFYVVNDFTRRTPIRLAHAVVRMLWILLRERPDAIVTTGSAPGLICIRLGKLFRARTIWIDSIANVEKLSLSGTLAGRYADLWLTQWPHLARPEGPHFAGAVL